MNNLDKIFEKNQGIVEFTSEYFKYLYQLLNSINKQEIEKFTKELEDSLTNENTIFIAGNGGSAATASHMANDMGMIAQKTGNSKYFKTLSLTDNVALISAIANDYGYDTIFVEQLKIYFKPGDKLIVISASGNSPNLIKAAEFVQKNDGKVIGLLGFDGGKLKDLSDISIIVETPKGEYGPVEDIHIILDHLVSNWLLLKSARFWKSGRFEILKVFKSARFWKSGRFRDL